MGSSATDDNTAPNTYDQKWNDYEKRTAVEKFDLDLLFPFRLVDQPRAKSGRSGHNSQLSTRLLEKWVSHLKTGAGAHWDELTDDFPNAEGPHAATEYSEWVFFHPFIRNFLYNSKQDIQQCNSGKPGNGKSLRILERKDLRHGQLKIDYFKPPADWDHPRDYEMNQNVTLEIRDVHLYLFDTGIGVLSVRLTRDADNGEAPLLLAQVMDIQDKVRRLYAPYFDIPPQPGKIVAGHCPDRLSIVTAGGATLMPSTFGTHDETVTRQEGESDDEFAMLQSENDKRRAVHKETIKFVQKHCEPWTAGVWQELLSPLKPYTAETKKSDAKLFFEHIVDERMPTLSYLAVKDPRTITDGDWLRLAVVDDSGNPECFPYSPRFTGEDPVNGFAYDRFWAQSDDENANLEYQQTRWLCCGYAMTAVGVSENSDFFTNENSGARAHFRYHYFKLNLIAQFHRVSLLVFKKRLSDAVEQLHQDDTSNDEKRFHQFTKKLEAIQLDLLAFRNMYWFTEISNQIQPQELFDLQSQHLRTRELFDLVFDESEKAAEFVIAHQERKQTEYTFRLGIMAAGFLVATPLAPVIFDHVPWKRQLLLMSTCLLGLMLLLWHLAESIKRLEWKIPRPWVVILALFMTVVPVAWAFRIPDQHSIFIFPNSEEPPATLSDPPVTNTEQ